MTLHAQIRCVLLGMVLACSHPAAPPSSPAAADTSPAVTVPATFELQGHRGARGRHPENTIEGLVEAQRLGVSVLETDLVVTKDGAVVLHHDVALHADTTRDASGAWLAADGPAIVTLTLQEVQTYDVGRIKPGSAYAARFPTQQGRDGVRIPTLAAALKALDEVTGGKARWNLEIKIDTEHPERTLPPAAAVDAMLAVVRAHGLQGRFMIQSFDWRVFERLHEVAPDVPTGCLTEPKRITGDLPALVAAAKCTYWEPQFDVLTADEVKRAHALGLKVVPWTVNVPDDLRRIVGFGVDGLISDYPDRVKRQPPSDGPK
jgi:glycerophosphoryl diester phosphodiesterase